MLPRCVCACFVLALLAATSLGGERKKVFVESTLDGHQQPCYVIEPDGYLPGGEARPLVVSLHSWSADVEQQYPDREAEANRRGWLYLFPNFRGRNDHPEACGSPLAQQDILDALAWTKREYAVDAKRVYLVGGSGGGHMTLLMAGRHPQAWTAASAWVGISDLAAWHAMHVNDKYGQMLRASCGGAPGESEKIDHEYRDRSPLTHLRHAAGLPLDIAAGVHDGHTGSVPVRHSLDAFNVVARASGGETISEEEIAQISRKAGRLANPRAGDEGYDETFARQIYLRREASKCRVSIFEGGHESLAPAAFAWLEKHVREAP